MDQGWLANGTAVLVLDAGEGEPTVGDGNNGQKPNPDYRPALVAVLTTEYHEPAQVLDTDPLADEDAGALTRSGGATQPGIVPGELRGPVPAPQAVPGPATAAVTTRSTAAEDPNVTAPGSAAAVGSVPASQIIATLRDLTTRAEAGDADAQAELEELGAAFDADRDEVSLRSSSSSVTDGDDRTQADTPETAPGGNGTAAGSSQAGPASATGAGDGPATA